MKKLGFRILKYTLIIIGSIIILAVVGLTAYYHSLYKDTPIPKHETLSLHVAQPSQPAEIVLLPIPKKIKWQKGSNALSKLVIQSSRGDQELFTKFCNQQLGEFATAPGSTLISFRKDSTLHPQGYRLNIQTGSINIIYNSPVGAYYAITTLKQITQQTSTLPGVEIEDHPDLNTRGVLIDISRGKVPTLNTLFKLVDQLAELKYNQIQLYVEGFSFGYPSFKKYWEKTETPLLPEEIRSLDQYCKERFIELVPNQNSLGHMQDWLKQDELKGLAECPEGYKLLGLIDMKTTLSPTDPKSMELVKQMSEDLLPNFTSAKFNVNLDEPFELGKSKQRPISDPNEIASLYMDYAKKLHEYVKSKNKSMMMWGDIVSRTPQIIGTIPKDITLLEWRYESFQDFEQICKKYQQAGLHYMVCPGTSSWSSYTGRTENMLHNINNAASSGVKYGAEGLLLTDWGDSPHMQYLTVSYPAFAWAAALSWNYSSKDKVKIDQYLNEIVFKDKSHRMGNLVLNLGRYNQFEEYPMMSMTTTNFASRLGMMDPVMFKAVQNKLQNGILELGAFDSSTSSLVRNIFANPKAYESEKILDYVNTLDAVLGSIHLEDKDGQLVVDEYHNSIRMIKATTLLKHYNLYHLQQTADQNRSTLSKIKSLCAEIIPEHKRLWLMRNKQSGLNPSLESFETLQADASKQLELLTANLISKWASRSAEKLKSAGAALYLR